MTDLPDRDRELRGSEVPSISRRVYFAWKRGDLKSRDEMDEEAAMRRFKEFWDRPFAGKDQDTLRAVLDAAWGVDDE